MCGSKGEWDVLHIHGATLIPLEFTKRTYKNTQRQTSWLFAELAVEVTGGDILRMQDLKM
jgi:hypothetical protein